MKTRIILFTLALVVLFTGNITTSVAEPPPCVLDEKYQPRWGDVEPGRRYDFLKAIWEDGYIQDFHIVIVNCEMEEFYPSSKRYEMSYEAYQEKNKQVMKNIKEM